MNGLEIRHLRCASRRVSISVAPPFLAMVAMNSPRAGRARPLQGENYV